jgi:hypothetical protein
MIKVNKERADVAKPVLDHAAKLDRGEILLYAEMERLSGVGRNDKEFSDLRRRVKNHFRDRGINVRSEPGVGYRLLQDSEASVICYRDRILRSGRQARRGLKELDNVRLSALNLHDRRNAVARRETLKLTAKQIRGNHQRAQNSIKRSDTLPQRKTG